MILYLDTETSGLYPGNICQLSYIVQTDSEVRAKNFFFKVDFVEYGAYMIHGFSVEKLNVLSGGKRFIDHIKEIENDLLDASLVVAHNTAFDLMFLRKEFENCGKILQIGDTFCSMKAMTPVCKLPRRTGAGYKYPKLNELCAFLGISDKDINLACKQFYGSVVDYHDARFDTVALCLACNRIMYGNYLDKIDLKNYL